jgi:phosphoglycolate phosphatase-like HAD superfamily hydrolase
METVLKKYPLPFDLTWSRENGPIKPQPDGILRACKTLGIAPERTCCVGDFDHDIFAANAAGAVSILLDGNHRCQAAEQADYVITHLEELTGILEI